MFHLMALSQEIPWWGYIAYAALFIYIVVAIRRCIQEEKREKEKPDYVQIFLDEWHRYRDEWPSRITNICYERDTLEYIQDPKNKDEVEQKRAELEQLIRAKLRRKPEAYVRSPSDEELQAYLLAKNDGKLPKQYATTGSSYPYRNALMLVLRDCLVEHGITERIMVLDIDCAKPLEDHINERLVWAWDPFAVTRGYTPEALRPYRDRFKQYEERF